ncbi:hypothetical protein PORCRE_1300 [Porphyromonas crevioricanis JCM 15906]|uniref:Uncharacterized protein n=1 Tax=Porphyromonas crevioricanis JCM 15906 TaxID=1305617 RepID=T1DS72_9PORP|nr:hypothetical protein PORCRE_1300 [Porphyromonas crevioricanis JCM 15906]
MTALNRTILELKRGREECRVTDWEPLNRTILELKPISSV